MTIPSALLQGDSLELLPPWVPTSLDHLDHVAAIFDEFIAEATAKGQIVFCHATINGEGPTYLQVQEVHRRVESGELVLQA